MSAMTDRADALRRWAEGCATTEAAIELLCTALNGRLLMGPWIRFSEHDCWFDPDAAASDDGHLSGGERRVLAVARSLVSPEHPVDLGDAITGIDPLTFVSVLQALGQAYGLSDSDDTEEVH